MKVNMQYLSTIRWCCKKKYLQIALLVFVSGIWDLNLVCQSYCDSEQLWEWKNVEKLIFYPLSTKDFSLKNDINPDTNLFNDAKFQKLHSYTVDKLIKFSSKFLKDFFSSKQRYELKFERTQIKTGRPHSESH